MASPYRILVYPSASPGGAFLSGVQAITWQNGQTYYQQPLEASTVTVVARYPNGYTTPNDGLTVSSQITLYTDTSEVLWDGIISDVSVQYGIPWNGTVGQGDTVTITGLGYWGETASTKVSTFSSRKLLSEYVTEFQTKGINLYATTATAVDVHGTPAKQTVADWTQALVNTYPFIMNEVGVEMYFDVQQIGGFFFSDTNPAGIRYDSFVVSSASLDTYGTVDVTGQNAVTGTATTGGTGSVLGNQTYSVTSLSPTAAWAQWQADFLLGNLSQTDQKVTTITYRDSLNTSGSLWMYQGDCGRYAQVEFRGDVYNCQVIGWQMSADPSDATWTLYVVPSYFAQWLVLDDNGDPALGALDSNRLGF